MKRKKTKLTVLCAKVKKKTDEEIIKEILEDRIHWRDFGEEGRDVYLGDGVSIDKRVWSNTVTKKEIKEWREMLEEDND